MFNLYPPGKSPTKKSRPKWQTRMDKSISYIRKELSIIDEIAKGTQIKSSLGRKTKRKYGISNNTQINILNSIRETLKQKLLAKAHRKRRIGLRCKFYRQNRLFNTDSKKFYRELNGPGYEVKTPPPMDEVTKFWSNIWDKPVCHKHKEWLSMNTNEAKKQDLCKITTEDVQKALAKAHKWKATGTDKIQNFWLHHLQSTHQYLATLFNQMLMNPTLIPKWMTTGITFLIPKNADTSSPKNYRPITCLSTTYKILTSILSDSIYKHLEENNLYPIEQKGCKKYSYGCKDQLLINKMILEDSSNNNKNLSTAWVDYQKAFDSVPHSWIITCLQECNIHSNICNFLKFCMSKWSTSLILNHKNGTEKSSELRIQRGIFQGDALSPLLFCIALFPLSKILNENNLGYKCKGKLFSHLLYMDDLKLYAKNDEDLREQLLIVKEYSDTIKMNFNVNKCAKLTIRRGKYSSSNNITLNAETTIRELEQHDTYKYLGVSEGAGLSHNKMKQMIRKEYIRRVRAVLQSQLNSRNKFMAINSIAIPVISYSFPIINWNANEVRNLDIKTRKLLTIHRAHHPKADTDRLYLKRHEGGRGLLQIQMIYKTTYIGMSKYLKETKDCMMTCVNAHHNNSKLQSIHYKAHKFKGELQMDNIPLLPGKDSPSATIQSAKAEKICAKKAATKQLLNNWKQKPLHGQFYNRATQADVDKEDTFKWLKSSSLKTETEGFIIAAQDQSLKTKNYTANIMKTEKDSKCRICDQHTETIDHIISGCPILAKKDYLERHNKVAQYIHYEVCKFYKNQPSGHRYTRQEVENMPTVRRLNTVG